MRVALDAGPLLDPPTGVGRYTRELSDALENLGVEVAHYAVSLRGRPLAGSARWRVPARALQTVWKRWDRPSIRALVGDADLVHGTNFVLPALGGMPGVVTVHDLSFERADAFPGGERLRDLVPWSIRRARLVLTPTEAVRAEVTDRYGLGSEDVMVTPEGVSPLFFGAAPLGDETLAGLGVRRPFAIAVGTIEPRKNMPVLLQAWTAAADALEEWTLVLAGPSGWGPQLPETPGVVPIGWVGDETLPGLLAASEFFCYPSLYEGFGLPPLEAMATGTAALVGRYSAAPEVLGDAVLLVDPAAVDEVASGLARLAGDPVLRASLGRAGRIRATSFTWERGALATLRAYHAAIET